MKNFCCCFKKNPKKDCGKMNRYDCKNNDVEICKNILWNFCEKYCRKSDDCFKTDFCECNKYQCSEQLECCNPYDNLNNYYKCENCNNSVYYQT